MMATIRKYGRYIAALFLLNFLFSLFNPSMAFALTAGPSSPEFSSFEPVTTTDMVNLFSGDLVYNLPVIDIPGPDGAGYALSLSYHSGSSSESEASWVGHGWTLNPGSINRDVRGYPDDYQNQPVQFYNKTKPNWTVSAITDLSFELMSKDLTDKKNTESIIALTGHEQILGLSATKRYNNYMGVSNSIGFNAHIKGVGNIGITYDGLDANLNVSINPWAILNKYTKISELKVVKTIEKMNQWLVKNRIRPVTLDSYTSTYGIYSLSQVSQPTTISAYTGTSFGFSASLLAAIAPTYGLQVGVEGNFNYQLNDFNTTLNSYGYLHTPSSGAENIAEDVIIEKQNSFNKRSRYLGIPFNTADNYILAGEGLSGGFRAYRSDVGTYFPSNVTSKTRVSSLGIEFQLGVSLAVGLQFGLGVSRTKLEGSWRDKHLNNNNDYKFNPTSPTEQKIMRFTNDLGGEINYSGNTDAESAGMNTSSNFPEYSSGLMQADEHFKEVSSSIAYHTQADYEADHKFDYHNNSIIYDPGLDESIREISITKEDGSNYVYGIPVYNRNQCDISVGADLGGTNTEIRNNSSLIQENVIEDIDNLKDNRTIVGTSKKSAYATTYLISQITGSNYYDRGQKGPDKDDYGAWTKFSYRKKYGGQGQWYKWRTPYSGLSYSKNTLAKDHDDMGSLSKGEKEVYYLKTVETKTHIAVFITNATKAIDFSAYNFDPGVQAMYLNGTGSRFDGLGAADAASNDFKARNTSQPLEKLEKIVLFSKNRPDKPIKVVHFDYNNGLVKNIPNNVNSQWPDKPTGDAYRNSGKLTLARVWFEYEGISNAKISPYSFEYQYYNKYPGAILSKYPALADYNNFSDVAQNPDYEPELLGPWGNIQYEGSKRAKEMKPWLYQGVVPDDGTFDPAAWQLKQIKLPSGGEIHIQYEEKDYCYVQDRTAMCMVSLAEGSDINSGVFYLNLADIGLSNPSSEDLLALQGLINEIKAKSGGDYGKMYFKFLVGLNGYAQGSFDNKNSEYIDGYTTIKNVSIDNSRKTIRLDLGSDSEHDTPGEYVTDYILTNNNFADGTFHDLDKDLADRALGPEGNDFEGILKTTYLMSRGFWDAFTGLNNDLSAVSPGNINKQYSYLKIPVPIAKRGGGVRVKRLLMYDPGFEGTSGLESIYGNEYKYITTDGRSSGVATNEPIQIREENALVGYLDRGERNWLGRLFYGRDRTEEEGPIGENVLPGPSVGHSRVVVENIHTGKTGTGHVVHEYYTVKDEPFDQSYNTTIQGMGFDATKINSEPDRLIIPAGPFNYKRNYDHATQGFRFIINNMHGQPKQITSYGGAYGSDFTYQTAYEQYEYYKPGESVEMIEFINGAYSKVNGNPGKEMDVTMYMGGTDELSVECNIEFDLGAILGSGIPTPFVTGFPTISISQSGVFTHAITKVISYPVILKKKTSIQENVKHVVENVCFDKYTGQPVVTKTYDEYHDLVLGGQKHDGTYYSTDLKAYWFYPEMGPVWKGSSNTNNLVQSAGSILTYEENPIKQSANSAEGMVFSNVVSANLQTYQRATSSMIICSDDTYAPEYLLPWSSYTYKANTVDANYTYEKGWTNENLNINLYGGSLPGYFDWSSSDPEQPSPWLRSTTIELYSDAGLPLMERNAMNIYSSAKYGYNNQLPVLVAQNAKYSSVYFYDFEVKEDCPAAWITQIPDDNISNAHSGTQSIRMDQPISLNTSDAELTANTSIKFWLKSESDVVATVDYGAESVQAKFIARSGEWALYEAVINTGTSSGAINLSADNSGSDDIWIDDLRIQPLDSEMKTFVYDKATFRLLGEFDNQHFGLYYQYNNEGKLVRKIIETERGRFTVQEKQYNQVKVVK